MSIRLDRAVKDFIQAIRDYDNSSTSPKDAQGEVLRIDPDGTAWVHFPGGVDETPVRLTINAEPGDIITARLSGGRAWITGNQTAPPTDDKAANRARKIANLAGNIARRAYRAAAEAKVTSQYLTYTDANRGVHVHMAGDSSNYGQFNANGMQVYKDDDEKAYFGDYSRIGSERSSNITITDSSMVALSGDGAVYYQIDANGKTKNLNIVTGKMNYTDTSSPFTVTYTLDELGIPTDQSSFYVSVYMRRNSSTTIDSYRINATRGTSKKDTNRLVYDGANSITVSALSVSYKTINVFGGYKKTVVTPTYSFCDDIQNSNGMFGMSLGQGTIAADYGLAVGTYNYEPLPVGGYLFIVGNGTESSRSNALAVDTDGYLRLKETVYVRCGADSSISSGYRVVDESRTVNGKALSSNITLSASDVGAVPTSRTVNGKTLSSDISLTASDVSAVPTSLVARGTAAQISVSARSYKDVDISFTGKSFSSNPTVTATLVSTSTAYQLGNVSVAVVSTSTTGATLRVFNADSTSRAPAINWIAIGI